MSFILSIVCLLPVAIPKIDIKSFRIEGAVQDEKAFARACYIPGLSRYFEEPIVGNGYHILVDNDAGYRTSNVFFPYPSDDSTPVRLEIGPRYRHDFDSILRTFIGVSRIGCILVISEYNGGVTNPDMDKSEVEAVDIIGPVTLQEFWSLHDGRKIFEDSIVIISSTAEKI